ncbi:unnamed protein product [Darwinula stevensoni]|uniref:Mitogen-activated protein kinase n=1 Tax=Darwinula stevensoni TaxID=69355 RepID=A0A7R9A7S2_9CRUS|nr:unnamed protein product [Darwinula stevensoni]CAG0894722.1 unnamed protein product [Darwinula stevensoni]
MAVVGPRHTRTSNLMAFPGPAAPNPQPSNPTAAVLAANHHGGSASYFHNNSMGPPASSSSNSSSADLQPDRPIGYGAFGVVWSVTDPRDGRRVALKKMPNAFQSLVSARRVFRELKMLCFFKHDNVVSALDLLQPPPIDFFQEIYVLTELMQSDLHKIIVSPQHLSSDHVKVFLYQILRGLKYIHSARILHRDIKPGNLLVNSNCVLKICDFGLARVEARDTSMAMTQEVVTQYYRAPELLLGARYYTTAVDIWSVGCIFAELLGRRILFQAPTPIQQLEMITDLLGTPNSGALKWACEGARAHMLRQPLKPPALSALYTLSPQASHEAVHLLAQMLVFDPEQRISCGDALAHPYLDEGRLRYHACMCTCCRSTPCGGRHYAPEFEPVAPMPFDDAWERDLTSLPSVKERMHKFISERLQNGKVPLCINPQSAAFKNFARSPVASVFAAPRWHISRNCRLHLTSGNDTKPRPSISLISSKVASGGEAERRSPFNHLNMCDRLHLRSEELGSLRMRPKLRHPIDASQVRRLLIHVLCIPVVGLDPTDP